MASSKAQGYRKSEQLQYTIWPIQLTNVPFN